ncbi:hypothetical protein EYC84_007166 [Monilinia fructicola]|uniref:HhH-GPD domain-containing protein n=1 Tax=Monilinia fructicola TaxID=38448 RepID=A0A5M9K8I1_MONFR|nr:hypothetical protein EYC84_007166 [Monilinia fructicola]
MTKRTSTQAAASPTGMEKIANDVEMKDVQSVAGAGEGEESVSSAKPSRDENETIAPVDGEKPAGSNKRKRDFKAERQAKRQRKEEIKAPKKAAAAIREAEQALEREKKAAAKAEAMKLREEQTLAQKEQKKEEKAKRYEENLRQQAEEKKKREEEKKRDLEAKKKDAAEKRKGEEKVPAVEKQVKNSKRGHGNENDKGKGAKKTWEKKTKGPKTSEFFGEGLKAQVMGLENESKSEQAESGEEVKGESSKKVKSKRSWKDLKKGNVAPVGLEEKIAAAKASVAQAESKIDDDVPMEDAPEAKDAEDQNEPEKETLEAAANDTAPVSYPSLEHLIEDSPEPAIEPEAPAETESQEVGLKVPEEISEQNVEEEKVNSEVSQEASKDQEEGVVSAEESSPAAQEGDETEEDTPKENAAPVAADAEIELEEAKEEVEANASAKKRSRKRVRNNNRLEAEETPTKPTAPASSNSQKAKTSSTTPLATKSQDVKTPSKSPAQPKAAVAKKGRPPGKAVNKAKAASKSAEEPEYQEIGKSQPLVEGPGSTSGIQLLDISLSHHNDDMIEAMGDELEGTASDINAVDRTEVDASRITMSGKRQRPPAHSPYFTQSFALAPSKSKDSIPLQGEASINNQFPKKGSPKKRSAGIISCIPFPPLSAPYFGLIQEKLAHDPFRLLIAVTFLNRTHGKHAIPVFYDLMNKYPTPQSIFEASKEDIQPTKPTLKFSAKNPPLKGKRYAVHDYPAKGLGRDAKKGEVLPEESVDSRMAWEIGHMTQGPYALDSWRIFCRDILLGKAQGWNGEGNDEEGFQPEWMRVVPEDKELRAFLRWMWLKEGFEWDPFTGEKEVAGKDLLRARDGREDCLG